MSLGFSVEALMQDARGGGALRMGLKRVDPAEWLQPDFDRAARADAFGRNPDSVQVMAGAEPAVAELCALLGTDSLAATGRAHWEDFCLLQRGGDGQYRLTAAALAFPTDWRLAEKLGLPLTQIHAPIHGYAEQLASGVDHFFATLAPGPIFGRANWFVVANADWRYMPADDPAARFAHVTAYNAGQTLFVRCERQTLRRLPETGAMLFTIGIAVSPLDSLAPATVTRVSEAVKATGSGEHERRAAPYYAQALADYAAARTDLIEAIHD